MKSIEKLKAQLKLVEARYNRNFENGETEPNDLLDMAEDLIKLQATVIRNLGKNAEIGMATEKFFNQNYERTTMCLENNGYGKVIAFNIDGLLRWYGEVKEAE